MLEEKRKQDGRGNKQQCLFILRQPGNGADGDKERRKERQREGREGRRRDKILCDLLLTVSPHLVTFYGLTNNTIILNITMDKPTDEPRDPRFHFPPPPCLDSQLGGHLSLPGDYFFSSQKIKPTHKSTTKSISSKCLASSGIFTYGVGVEKTM